MLPMLDPSGLYARKLLLVTGKGGIGKTLVAAALGQRAAAMGMRTLLVESAACDQIAPLFGSPGTEHVERSVGPNLTCINLHPPDNFRAYVSKYLGQPRLYETVFNHKVVNSFINTIPGLAEVMLLGRLFYHAELEKGGVYDLIVFDSFASGHFLSLMTTPQAVIDTGIGGPLVAETTRVQSFLADGSKTGIVYVAAPAALVISETLDVLPQLLAKSPAKVAQVVLNRVPGRPSAKLAGSAAAVYLQQRFAAAVAAEETLARGLAELGLPYATLADLGFIDEPIAPDFATSLFGL